MHFLINLTNELINYLDNGQTADSIVNSKFSFWISFCEKTT